MTGATKAGPLAAVLTELGWKPEVLARRLNSFAALHGRRERMHVKTPYKWLHGTAPSSPWSALALALLTEELGRPVTAAELGWSRVEIEAVSALSGLVLPWTAAGSLMRSGWSPTLGTWTDESCSPCWALRSVYPPTNG